MQGSHSINYHRYYDQKYNRHTPYTDYADDARHDGPAAYRYNAGQSPYPYLKGYSTPAGYRTGSEPLYGDALVSVCKETRSNLQRLRETLTNVDQCYQFGVEHWHFNNTKPEPKVETPEHMRPKWSASDTVFGSRMDMRMVDWKRPHSGNIEPEDTGPVNKFCYLCTTLDEHRQHLARRGPQLKAKEKRRPRVDFIVPLPGTRAKREEIADKEECLYKITVRTGNKPNAATSASVFIRLKGRDGITKPRQLTKKTCVNFTFGRATKETFYIKTPILGQLLSLIVSHDGLEKKHSWYLEEVEVCDVAARQVYLFTCRQWLSLHQGDHSVKRELRAEVLETFQREYLINVTTGNKTLAGTDANVTLTLFGKLGSSKKLKLSRKVKDRETLQKGATDTFNLVEDDIGALQKLRIEHDNSGRSPDWFLEKIEVEESERLYVFPCGRWVPADEEQDQKRVSLDLYPIRGNPESYRLEPKRKGKEDSANLVDYMVTIMTGDIRGAGTDAHVYLILIGKKGPTREVELDDVKNNFERGMTDEFKIKAEDVGNLKKIRIRHDNTSLAAGWYLDKVIIRRFFTKKEIREKLSAEGVEEDEKALRRASMITGQTIKGRDVEKARKKREKASKEDSDDSDSEDDSDDSRRERRRTRNKDKKNRSRSRGKRGSSESDSDDKKSKRKKEKKGKKGKKKFTYGGIDTWVTDSDSDSDDDTRSSRSKGSKGSKKKSNRYDSDSDESNWKIRSKRDKNKNKRYDSGDSDDYDKKRRNKKGKKKKNRDDSDDSDDSDKDFRKLKNKNNKKKKKSKYGDSDSDSDDDTKKKKRSKKYKKSDSDSDSDDDKSKTRKSKSRKLRFKSSESDSDSDSESSSDSGKKNKRNKKGSVEEGRRKVGKDSDSDNVASYHGKLFARWREDRIPYCDEYEFECRRWLATDEDDKQIQRDLKPASVTTFYKKT